MQQATLSPPLDGINVIDLSRVLAGPYSTMMLADLGADVLKIEMPGKGDDTRQWGPPFAGSEAAYYLAVNRGKQSVTINLDTERGRDILRELVRSADVVVENFRVGTMQRWGLGFESLKELNPRLIYCAITGYGQYGPYCDRPGYDFIIQAQGGTMSITGEADGSPTKVGVAIVDITAGLYATIAILAALHERERSGEGQSIDISLLDSQVAWLANVASNYLVSGEKPLRYGNAHPNIVPYELFPTSDGWFAVGVGNDRQWERLCRVAGWEDLAIDVRYSTNPLRVKNRHELIAILQTRFQECSTEQWESMLLESGIPCARVNTIDRVFSDPQVLARNMLVELSHPILGELKVAGSPIKYSHTPVKLEKPPPLLGEHTDEVLKKRLGYSAGELAHLRAVGVI
jgi:formyl-CoA transferase